jgi:hypothetical protein
MIKLMVNIAIIFFVHKMDLGKTWMVLKVIFIISLFWENYVLETDTKKKKTIWVQGYDGAGWYW